MDGKVITEILFNGLLDRMQGMRRLLVEFLDVVVGVVVGET
jgi:hypothetical protein